MYGVRTVHTIVAPVCFAFNWPSMLQYVCVCQFLGKTTVVLNTLSLSFQYRFDFARLVLLNRMCFTSGRGMSNSGILSLHISYCNSLLVRLFQLLEGVILVFYATFPLL